MKSDENITLKKIIIKTIKLVHVSVQVIHNTAKMKKEKPHIVLLGSISQSYCSGACPALKLSVDVTHDEASKNNISAKNT